MVRAVLLFAVLLPLGAASACGDDGGTGMTNPAADAGARSDSGGSAVRVTDSAQFLIDYASAVCAMYEPCCEAQSLGYDAAGCTEWYRKVTAAYFGGEFRADKARECLEAVEEAFGADPDRCANVVAFDEATLRETCREAFGAAPRSGSPLGGSCLLGADCASAPEGEGDGDGNVICYSGTCLLERKGKAGDGPCYLGGNSGIDGVPDVAVTCHAADGLWCDRGANVCAPQVEAGGRCPFGNACKAGALCSGGTCLALPGPGERCLNAIPGAGGFCRAGSACDVASLTCSAPLAEGAACREPAQCASGSCMGGRCTKADFTRSLNCTGG
jgi:hypothetical protein